MKKIVLSTLFAFFVGSQGFGQILKERKEKVQLNAELLNIFLFRNDSDFDRSPPHYNENGQTVGAVATMLTPKLTLNVTDNMRIYYELELGLNYWSKNNPDTESALSQDVFIMKHREIFGEGKFLFEDGKRVGFKAGYQRFMDSTGLFVNHWLGLGRVFYEHRDSFSLGVFGGELPDQTYEGITIRENNFKRDIVLYGLATKFKLKEGFFLDFGVHNVYDSHVVGRTRHIFAPNVRFSYEGKGFKAYLDGVFQTGLTENSTLYGKNQYIAAWALQTGITKKLGAFTVLWNALFLSPDDDHDGNKWQRAFFYSAKPKSLTRLLTEDEVRDVYDNYDERISQFDSGFYINRAGLFLTDVSFAYKVTKWFEPMLVVGASTVLNKKNALGNTFLGVETDLDLKFSYRDFLEAHVVGLGLFPGRALAAMVNTIDKSKNDILWAVEVAMTLRY